MKKQQPYKQPSKRYQRNYSPQQSFKKKSFQSNQPPRQQGFRKRNKFPERKPFHARAAYIEEVEQDEEEPYEQEDDIPDLAARTSRLSDDKKERLLAELKELDIHF
jgi:hypothetical protein